MNGHIMSQGDGGGYGSRLDDAVVALERGDWRAAVPVLFSGDPVDGEHEIRLIVVLRCVTRAMRLQCTSGDLVAAQRQLDTARAALEDEDERRRAEGADRRTQSLTEAGWRLVSRETADLIALRRLVADVPRGRDELTYACIEWLTWVEFDPWTVQHQPRERQLLLLEGSDYARFHVANRKDMCDRATRLRKFVGDRGGEVTETAWKRMRGYPGLRVRALLVLSREEITRGRADLPVRLGRVRAWEYACGLSGDIAT